MRIVIPSVHYADYLSVTLPAWRAFRPAADITVVTAPNDTETPRVVGSVPGVRCLVTDAWTRPVPTMNGEPGRVVFNKALAMDEAFGFVPGCTDPPRLKEYCLALDADVYPFGIWPQDAKRSDTLYSCPRYECLTRDELLAHQAGRTTTADLHLIPPKIRGDAYARLTSMTPEQAAARCLGYFQLFRYLEGRRFGSYRTAGKYDMEFRHQFAQRRGLTSVYVLHLGEQNRQNWQGRVLAALWGNQ